MYIDHGLWIANFHCYWKNSNAKSDPGNILIPIPLIKGKRYQRNNVDDK